MKNKLLILLLLLSPGLAGAEVYKQVDEQGRITYTDKPRESEEEAFEVPKTVNEVEMPKASRPGSAIRPKPKPAPPRYRSLKVTAPENDAVIRDNEGKVTVTIATDPKLQTERQHAIGFYLDGKYIDKTTSNTYVLENLDRGTHELIVVIQDANGKPLKSADKIVFHLKRFFR